MRKAIFLTLAAILTVSFCFADTIVLKSGKKVEGKILEKSADALKIDISGMSVNYFLDEIDSINGEKPVIPVAAPAVGSKNALPEQVEPSVVETETFSVTAQKEPGSASLKIDIKKPAEPAAEESYKIKFDAAKAKPIAAAVSITVLLMIFFAAIIFYVYTSICLQLIAKKTETAPGWLAWIPIANIFLMCKIASVGYWWIAVLLLSFLPFAGMLVSLGFFGFLWYKIALARNKPGWIGLLSVIPIVNLVIYGYLAFAGEGSGSTHSALPLTQPKSPPTPPPAQPTPPPL